jgi:hypothetical protein
MAAYLQLIIGQGMGASPLFHNHLLHKFSKQVGRVRIPREMQKKAGEMGSLNYEAIPCLSTHLRVDTFPKDVNIQIKTFYSLKKVLLCVASSQLTANSII